MDKINFTGIRNIGAYGKKLPYMAPNQIRTHMIINLTDDYNGKDLTEFKEVAKKCKPILNNLYFPKDSNFIHIMTSLTTQKGDIPELAVNHVVIPARNETLSIFSYVAKLTRRIANMTDNEFKIAKDFKYNSDGDEFIFPILKVSDIAHHDENKTKALLDEIYSPETSRNIAKTINKHITMQMIDFLK